MTPEEIKKIDKRVQEIQYPFGKNYPVFHKIFTDVAEQHNIPVAKTIQQYSEWKSSKA